MTTTDLCVERYRDLKNLKLVGAELGMPWQTVYWRLKRAGEPVSGDKERYGSETDRLAARAERWFKAAVPHAVNMNTKSFQSKVDFMVGLSSVDIKVSRPRITKTGVRQWSWSVKKQEMVADYFVCIALVEVAGNLGVTRAFLLPGDIVRHYQTIRVSGLRGVLRGKWAYYAVTTADLARFFAERKHG